MLLGEQACDAPSGDDRAALLRLAAESRARGWVHLRARWTAEAERPPWARAALGIAPWSRELSERRVAALRDYVLLALADAGDLQTGLGAYAAPVVLRARCSQ